MAVRHDREPVGDAQEAVAVREALVQRRAQGAGRLESEVDLDDRALTGVQAGTERHEHVRGHGERRRHPPPVDSHLAHAHLVERPGEHRQVDRGHEPVGAVAQRDPLVHLKSRRLVAQVDLQVVARLDVLDAGRVAQRIDDRRDARRHRSVVGGLGEPCRNRHDRVRATGVSRPVPRPLPPRAPPRPRTPRPRAGRPPRERRSRPASETPASPHPAPTTASPRTVEHPTPWRGASV